MSGKTVLNRPQALLLQRAAASISGAVRVNGGGAQTARALQRQGLGRYRDAKRLFVVSTEGRDAVRACHFCGGDPERIDIARRCENCGSLQHTL